MIALGFDTSNYTTSCAWFDGAAGENHSRLLDVQQGALGLRQSDALFLHIKRLPELSDRLFARLKASDVGVIGVSTRPRTVDGSYMPCFLAGESLARSLGAALHVPVRAFSHQQGHIAAALWSAGRMELTARPFLAWHLSGGTTELLRVTAQGAEILCEKIGGTTDVSAGQLIDRTGQLLSLPFPAGKALDMLSTQAENRDGFRVKLNGLSFSLSGVQNKVTQLYAQTEKAADTAYYALNTICCAVRRATEAALKEYPGYPVLFSGGVASNSMLRTLFSDLDAVFAAPELSTDNAMGAAVLAFISSDK